MAKCSALLASFVMVLATILAGVSVGVTWWKDGPEDERYTFSLWKMGTNVMSQDEEMSYIPHDDMCEHASVNSALNSYCKKIAVARAFSILTACSALFSAATLMLASCKKKLPLLTPSIGMIVLTIVEASLAIGFGVKLMDDNMLVKKPEVGFILMCMVPLFALMSLFLTIHALCTGKDAKATQGICCCSSKQAAGSYWGSMRPTPGMPFGAYGSRPPVGAQEQFPPKPQPFGMAPASQQVSCPPPFRPPSMQQNCPQPQQGVDDFGVSASKANHFTMPQLQMV